MREALVWRNVFLSVCSRTLTPPLRSTLRHYPSSSSKSVQFNRGIRNSSQSASKSVTSKSGFAVMNCGGVVDEEEEEEEEEEEDDGFYIRKCVELARKAIGHTSPNPMVGCVIVKDGKIVGQGFHPKAGQPHAEVFALRDAGELAENATAYVSLEPCNHFGKTPPCTEALIKAKVKKVVVGMIDPNPIVASKGVQRLRDAGIDVEVGVEDDMCRKLNEAFIHRMLTGKPFVALRYSMSVTGHLLDELGESVAEQGGYYSQLLQEYDVVIASASLAAGSSILSSQESGAKQPFWVVTTKQPLHIRTPFEDETSTRLLVVTDKDAAAVEPELAKEGTETVVLDRINLEAILEYCKHQGACSVLLDFRGSFGDLEELVRDGMECGMLQKLIVEVLPVWNASNVASSRQPLTGIGTRLKLKNLYPKSSGTVAQNAKVIGKEPKDEVQIYTWNDATLGELTDLVKCH